LAFHLIDLPYSQGALAPHMSAETIEFHYGKHHAGYVSKLNDVIKDTAFADLSLEDIIKKAAGDDALGGLFNNAAQVWNHDFFWNCLSPNGGGKPEGELLAQIESDFVGFDGFLEAFKKAATGQFGSGWAWLVRTNGKLDVISTQNAIPPMVQGQQALLTCDVWEHAYYLDYRNERPRFVSTFLEHLVNWDFVAEQYDAQQ
jgi:Fe-Mn family superoxide dismutase